jgi:hypothetical protein
LFDSIAYLVRTTTSLEVFHSSDNNVFIPRSNNIPTTPAPSSPFYEFDSSFPVLSMYQERKEEDKGRRGTIISNDSGIDNRNRSNSEQEKKENEINEFKYNLPLSLSTSTIVIAFVLKQALLYV